jgi:predicted Zn-dependent protease
MVALEPGDTFLRYALAMEMRKEGATEDSLRELDSLTKDSPPYVPAYLMAAQQLVDQARIPEAREYLRQGIDEARRQGDLHAAGEMSELLSHLGQFGS